MPERPRSFYSRLVTDKLNHYPASVMTQLADWMEDTDTHRGNRRRAVPGAIPSGYVYFAQFVTHDLSRDHTSLSDAGNTAPEQTSNWRTPSLDLEILYGEDRRSDSILYDPSHPRGSGYLMLGSTSSTLTVSDNDLNRDDATGSARIFDLRNDTTLLLAQLQVLMIKFHNRLLEAVRDGNVDGVSGGDDFEETKRLVTWHYQWIVQNDLLPKIVMPEILSDIRTNGPKLFQPRRNQALIPVEFTLAAFQYGHSAVQFIYNINRNLITCPQEDTMYLTGLGHFSRPSEGDRPSNQLPERFVLDAGRAFGWAPPARSNFSAPIDTLITTGLYKVPGNLSILLNNEPLEDTGLTLTRSKIPTFKLPEATLRRGAAVGLPSGQTACKAVGAPCLRPEELAYDSQLQAFLNRNGLLDSTPLFYYLMREAEVLGRAAPTGESRKRLGPLGSRIVAEVILGVLDADPSSYIHTDWALPIISEGPDSKIRIDSLRKLALFATGYKGHFV